MKELFGHYLKSLRTSKGLLVKQLAHALEIDAGLVSKFEKGTRLPTRDQAIKLADLLETDRNDFITRWLGMKLYKDLGSEPLALEALTLAEGYVKYHTSKQEFTIEQPLQELLDLIDQKRQKLSTLRESDNEKLRYAFELEYTYESNRIEGNTLTLQETELVVQQGLTIAGKTVREHLEAINHTEAIALLKDLVAKRTPINTRTILMLHGLVLRGIDKENAGRYRTVPVRIAGSTHTPPQPYLLVPDMEAMMDWYVVNADRLHPVVLAAEMHYRLVTIHPFIDGNGRTSRLLMNLILLKSGYVIANISGDNKSRLAYYKALDEARTEKGRSGFIKLVAQIELDCITQYLRYMGEG